MDYLTFKHLKEYHDKGCSFTIYPRKLEICVNGFKYFRISPATVNKWNYYKKTGFAVHN